MKPGARMGCARCALRIGVKLIAWKMRSIWEVNSAPGSVHLIFYVDFAPRELFTFRGGESISGAGAHDDVVLIH